MMLSCSADRHLPRPSRKRPCAPRQADRIAIGVPAMSARISLGRSAIASANARAGRVRRETSNLSWNCSASRSAEHGAGGDIVGAIANEAELDSRYIGRVRINDDHTTVELPVGMPDELLGLLQKVRVRNTPIRLQRVADGSPAPAARPFKAKRTEGGSPEAVPRRRDAGQGSPRSGGGRRSNDPRSRGPGTGPRSGEGPRPKLRRKRD